MLQRDLLPHRWPCPQAAAARAENAELRRQLRQARAEAEELRTRLADLAGQLCEQRSESRAGLSQHRAHTAAVRRHQRSMSHVGRSICTQPASAKVLEDRTAGRRRRHARRVAITATMWRRRRLEAAWHRWVRRTRQEAAAAALVAASVGHCVRLRAMHEAAREYARAQERAEAEAQKSRLQFALRRQREARMGAGSPMLAVLQTRTQHARSARTSCCVLPRYASEHLRRHPRTLHLSGVQSIRPPPDSSPSLL